jgi:hypothetical protein
VSEAARALLVAAIGAAIVLMRMAAQAGRMPASSPERLVEEFRLIRLASLVLGVTAGTTIGLAVAHENAPGTAVEIALAVFVAGLAAYAATCEPRKALGLIVLGFVAHALMDIGHRPGLLPNDLVPRWYLIGCAIYDSAVAGICYWPVFRR